MYNFILNLFGLSKPMHIYRSITYITYTMRQFGKTDPSVIENLKSITHSVSLNLFMRINRKDNNYHTT